MSEQHITNHINQLCHHKCAHNRGFYCWSNIQTQHFQIVRTKVLFQPFQHSLGKHLLMGALVKTKLP